MSSFEYIEKDGKVYVSFMDGRLVFPWLKRWVPSWATIVPAVEDGELDFGSTGDVEDKLLSLSVGEVEGKTLTL